MPRQSRIDAPGALHHIICRGIERRRIFLDDEDREDFVERLGYILLKTSTRCFAWALIPNHFHLLLETGTSPITTVMERLLTGYAINFNHRHQRHGHLFQNRYKSILCQTDPYLLELVRYIHLNPLRAGLVGSLLELGGFPYSGHRAILDTCSRSWEETGEVLSRFGQNPVVARKRYESYVAEGLTMGKRPDLIGGGLLRSAGGWEHVRLASKFGEHLKSDERILGDSDFVEQVLSLAQERMDRADLLREKGMDLDTLAQKVAETLGIDPAEIWKGGKRPATVRGRSLLCYWAISELGMTAEAVSKAVCITAAATVRAAQRGEALAIARALHIKE